MYFNKKALIIGTISLGLLGGCAMAKPALEGRLDAEFGSAIRANTQAHAIAPTPRQKADTYIPADPSRTALARKNYRENTVTEPQPINQNGG